jgi:hypothetical protein
MQAIGHGVRATCSESRSVSFEVLGTEAIQHRTVAAELPQATGIDKSVLTLATPRRYRNKAHLRYVAQQPCLVCGRKPSDAHHLRFMQPRALGRKVSDEFTVPLCRIHHRLAHRVGNEGAWWQEAGIDAVDAARKLWERTRLDHDQEAVGAGTSEPKDAGCATANPSESSHVR